MDSNFVKDEFLVDHDIDQHAELHGTQAITRQINEQNKTIAVQRKIIGEQAITIQALQAKVKKYGWNV